MWSLQRHLELSPRLETNATLFQKSYKNIPEYAWTGGIKVTQATRIWVI